MAGRKKGAGEGEGTADSAPEGMNEAVRRRKGRKETVLALCAHSDDQVLGAGGTLAKYAQEGKKVIIIIFSYGEKSHPWLKKKVTAKMRVGESRKASEILGAQKTFFYGIKEGRFEEQIKERDISSRLAETFRKYRPSKVFTHAGDDPHPDHKALNDFVLSFCDNIGYNGDVYSFDVWNPLKFKERNLPRMVVDISKTFGTKIKALRCFESQKLAMLSLLWSVYYRAIKNGIMNHCWYAEVFYKIR
ncbi:MAG: PIG-L deacetylase family protein [Candidatus Woesearchaeota archaeon]